MYNEEAHCEAVIAHACAIKYPRERLLIQVLDDSTKEAIKHQVDLAVAAQARRPPAGRGSSGAGGGTDERLRRRTPRPFAPPATPRRRAALSMLRRPPRTLLPLWVHGRASEQVEAGHPVQVMRRENRHGFKAGGLVHGLNRVEGQGARAGSRCSRSARLLRLFAQLGVRTPLARLPLAAARARWRAP
jgi:hypothetical protein